MKEYLKIIDEIIALVGLHLIPKFVNLYQGQVDIRCEENDTGVLINIIVSLPDKNELQALQNQVGMDSLLRRAQILNEHKIVIGSTEFDYDAMTVTTDKESLVLPKKEFLLLYKLAASPGRTFTKQQLMDEVWGYETEADPHTIEVHIGRIRERFKDNPDFEIVTMRGIGYKVVKK